MISWNSIARALLLLFLVMTAPIPVPGQSQPPLDQYGRWINGVSEPWWFAESIAREDIAVAQKKWAAIEDEIRSLEKTSSWPGTYFTGSDTHGSYLRWSPRNGFVLLNVNKCEARVMAFSYGGVVSSSTLVQLLPEKSASDSVKHSHGIESATRFVQVIWRGSLELVSEDRITDYCDYTAGLGAYNDWFANYIELVPFFSRLNVDRNPPDEPSAFSEQQTVTKWEAPRLPPGYEQLIRRPINATIVSLGKSYVRRDPENEWWDELVTPVTIKLSRTGASPGTKLYLTESDDIIEIKKFSGRSARGLIVRSVRKRPCIKWDETDDCSDPDDPPIKVGWKASTFRL